MSRGAGRAGGVGAGDVGPGARGELAGPGEGAGGRPELGHDRPPTGRTGAVTPESRCRAGTEEEL